VVIIIELLLYLKMNNTVWLINSSSKNILHNKKAFISLVFNDCSEVGCRIIQDVN